MAAEHTVILGSGIIGVSTAYYLSLSVPPSTIHLVDPALSLFSSASGHAGGFLAKDWFSPKLESLGELSYEEHRRLARENAGEKLWGYAESQAVSYSPVNAIKGERSDDWLRSGASRSNAAKGTDVEGTATGIESESAGDKRNAAEETSGSKDLGEQMPWLRRDEGDTVESISTPGTTAQVDPKKLSEWLLKQCLERGVQLHHPAEAVSIDKDMRDSLSSVRIVDKNSEHEVDIPCTRLIICAGLWTPKVFERLFPGSGLKLPISSIAGHSIIVRSPKWQGATATDKPEETCHAIFTAESSEGFAPELFTRSNGDIYLAGLNTHHEDQMGFDPPSPAAPSQPLCDHIQKLNNVAAQLLGGDLQTVKTALCYRPVTRSGLPIIERLRDEDLGGVKTLKGEEGGVYVVCGHGPWGISLSLGTGKVVSEMVRGVKTSADIKGLLLKAK